MPRRQPAKLDGPTLLMALVIPVFMLVFVVATGSWGLLGISPGGRLQMLGRGQVAYQAVTLTSREFGSRAFRVRQGHTVAVDYALAGETGRGTVSVSLCRYTLWRPDCEILHLERLESVAQGRFEVTIPHGGRCDVDLWVRDYRGSVALGWVTR